MSRLAKGSLVAVLFLLLVVVARVGLFAFYVFFAVVPGLLTIGIALLPILESIDRRIQRKHNQPY